MTGARLASIRLQGFKSFAERTHLELGPGISAVVGPNGSGKSNLADALRWAFGEQGRALRTRRSEDVIFAGSERRAALGMADVTIVLDNGDGLFPVEFGSLELGRRLYRSGENDYLLNRQRVRLRDLVDLLDAANLADNAFLFIGQGMVDQALSLKPEERRSLFEEVAGVRRHERRRRRAEEQLIEAESNLARIEDIVVELRPQVRRLAAQAEQQTTRRSAGDELAAAVVAVTHERWHAASARAAEAVEARSRAREDADTAMRALAAAEAVVASVAADLSSRSTLDADRRAAHDAAQAELTALRIREGRLTADLDALERDRRRADAERAAAEAEATGHRRAMSLPIPARDHEAEAALAEAERALADALAELAALRAAHDAEGEALAAIRRVAAVRGAELETARRRLAEAERRLEEGRAAARLAERRRAELGQAAAATNAAMEAAAADEARSIERVEEARAAAERAEAVRVDAAGSLVTAREGAAGIGARLRELEARVAEDEARTIARRARRVGGRRVDEELAVQPELRAAVDAALGELGRAYVVPEAAIPDLVSARGMLVAAERVAATPLEAGERRLVERAAMAGGGSLADAIRRDPGGAARAALERAVWMPDLASALALQPSLPPGWIAVSRDGSAVVGSLAVAAGDRSGRLDRTAELERTRVEHDRAQTDLAGAESADRHASAEAARARAALAEARAAAAEAEARRRAAVVEDQGAVRELERSAREAAWHEAAVATLGAERDRAAEAMAALEVVGSDAVPSTGASGTVGPGTGSQDERAAEAWAARVDELRARRDRLADAAGAADQGRREAEARRARAEAGATLAEERIARAVSELERLGSTETGARAALAATAAELAAAVEREARARADLEALRTADAGDRERLALAEADATRARERLRAGDERARAADLAEVEARLAIDAIRESALVELAGLADVGIRHLEAVAGRGVAGPTDGPLGGDDEDDGERLERALAAAAATWAATPPTGPGPTTARLAALRRRFHELGAANPYAVEEHAELRTRLETLEAQADDVRSAIARTRALIAELTTLVADQFRTTFSALESAFDARFRQLFGGGFARLTMTDPSDLAATGIDIVARPPGKKAQNLAMLSGGERALTAVALLFAMLEVRPVPFCVLDEVDAALDEANVGRFTEALRELASGTQCIVITHNRGTIESADALYGVTVGDDSVSRVISLRLDEAQAIADEARQADVVAAG